MERHLNHYNINRNKIDIGIDKEEVLRYLGYEGKKVDDITDLIIDECIGEILEISRTSFIYNTYEVNMERDFIFFKNTNFKIKGEDISKHLQNSKKCVIMAVTLGNEVDERIRYYSKVDLTRSLIFDACTTAAIEALCDWVERLIKKMSIKDGYKATTRYSPGYGDLSIEIQPKILRLLDTQKHIGLTVTDSFILLPKKSVTAFIGIGKDVKSESIDCRNCSLYKNCLFEKEGDSCGNSKPVKK